MPIKTFSGINVQYPVSQMIISGQKTIETRKYPIPQKYINKKMLLIETPGKVGNFKARIIGIVVFEKCFKYSNKNEFYGDIRRHLVDEKSPWAWIDGDKWGWIVKIVKKFSKPISLSKRTGMVYTSNITITF